MTEYTYTDRYGSKLIARPSGSSRADVEIRLDGDQVDIPSADLPKVVAKVYSAAGRKSPVVHEHVDDEGVGISIVSSEYRPDTAFIESTGGAYVTPADLPGLVAKLYRATGQEPPILLPHREADTAMTRGRKVRPLMLSGDDMEPADARNLASWYATAADLADAEPDPEQVKKLAEVIGGMYVRSPEAIAHAVLAAGYTRGES